MKYMDKIKAKIKSAEELTGIKGCLCFSGSNFIYSANINQLSKSENDYIFSKLKYNPNYDYIFSSLNNNHKYNFIQVKKHGYVIIN